MDRLLAEIDAADAGAGGGRAGAWRCGRTWPTWPTASGTGVYFEGYVLSALLDEALDAANRRLPACWTAATPSAGGRSARAAPAGWISRCWTAGTPSPGRPATLSGGEGFCASLALALGLAETVAAHAGAHQLDALFIDEGFGTLDAETLETAIGVLEGLQAGDRLVGVISHVPELRERIPARLEVTPGRRGSTAAFRIG